MWFMSHSCKGEQRGRPGGKSGQSLGCCQVTSLLFLPLCAANRLLRRTTVHSRKPCTQSIFFSKAQGMRDSIETTNPRSNLRSKERGPEEKARSRGRKFRRGEFAFYKAIPPKLQARMAYFSSIPGSLKGFFSSTH